MDTGPGVVRALHWVETIDVHGNGIPNVNGNPMGIPREWK